MTKGCAKIKLRAMQCFEDLEAESFFKRSYKFGPALNSRVASRGSFLLLVVPLHFCDHKMSSPPPIDFPTSDMDAEMEDGTNRGSGTGPLFLPQTPSTTAGTPARQRGSGALGSDAFRGSVARRAVGFSTPRRDPLFLGQLFETVDIHHNAQSVQREEAHRPWPSPVLLQQRHPEDTIQDPMSWTVILSSILRAFNHPVQSLSLTPL